ncbi:hypothetical protein CHS0354_022692 [Potamilus streckersoni]|uniref:Uncharacterized protein n=1 Tax=Potamilus streckersoni TaxID=2493646 RepID=A0AAE0SHT9_9BIVA|nr:hypothetical protein CHS0354_022692 [Potamilus streckersoni]
MGSGVTHVAIIVTETNGKPEDNLATSDTGDSGEVVRLASGIQAQKASPNLEFESSVLDSDCKDDSVEKDNIDKVTNQKSQETLKECKVCLLRKFILSGVNNGKDPRYYGITCLSDGRIVITDSDNNRCCLYDSSYNHVLDFMLSPGPCGICTVDVDEVAVAFHNENKIQFLKIGDQIQPLEQISTERRCVSIVALNKVELVYVGTTNDASTYYYGVITRDGQEKSCFHIPRGDISYCNVYIALNSSKTRAYISCRDVRTVYCVGLDGIVYFEYKIEGDENQGYPLGIQLDRKNNVYVVVMNSNSIHRLSPECQLQQIAKNMIPTYPRAICFQQSCDNFLLTSGDARNLHVCYVYELK